MIFFSVFLESSETDVLKQLHVSTAFAISNLTSEEKHNCMDELKASVKQCQETELVIERLRYKKPFVRSTQLTNRLGKDSRLFSFLKKTITRGI